MMEDTHIMVRDLGKREFFRKLARKVYPPPPHYGDFDEADIQLIEKVRPFTMTSSELIYTLVRAIEYIIRNDIPGDLVECGVWRGGSMMAAAITLLKLKSTSRHLYL